MSEALERSIEKWRRNADNPLQATVGSDTCPLCHEHLGNDCLGCPVAERTGKESCEDTPYYNAATEIWRVGQDPTPENIRRARDACQREVEFLEGLRND